MTFPSPGYTFACMLLAVACLWPKRTLEVTALVSLELDHCYWQLRLTLLDWQLRRRQKELHRVLCQKAAELGLDCPEFTYIPLRERLK